MLSLFGPPLNHPEMHKRSSNANDIRILRFPKVVPNCFGLRNQNSCKKKKMLHPKISRESHNIIFFEFSASQIPIKNFTKETGHKGTTC